MFERADMLDRAEDYTELLMPDDLLSPDSIFARLREVMTEDACQDVEIIGWLYQFYISEKKDQVFAGLKKNVKITAENIPAATQLFTPHWIVRYLVENSLGRLWLLNRPQSKLAAHMDYYIAPEEPETDFLRVERPEDIHICDPACGSGHMLTYAFDVLFAIYEEEGYEASTIPALILTHNLTGIEIDDRAGALAAFALSMKAAARLGRRRFLRMDAKPAIVVLQNVIFTPAEMQDVAAAVGRDLFTDELRETLLQFEQAKNFGSLIVPKLPDPAETLRVVEARDFGSDLLRQEVQVRVAAVLQMAEALSPKYHVVVANPPYMGAGGMNGALGDWVKAHYPDSKSDLFSAFIERGILMTLPKTYTSMVTMESWMFLSSYEKLRVNILSRTSIRSLVHMPYLGKGGTSMGINFGTSAFVVSKLINRNHKADFCCVRYYETNDLGVPFEFPPKNERLTRASARDFENIPGHPILYQLSQVAINSFKRSVTVSELGGFKRGTSTADNNRFLRNWFEVPNEKRGAKWRPYNKGGDWRRWYGNQLFNVNWGQSGEELKSFKGAYVRNAQHAFKPAVSYSSLTSGAPSFRYYEDHLHDQAGNFMPHCSTSDALAALACLNSKFGIFLAQTLSPTLNILIEDLGKIPVMHTPRTIQIANMCVEWAKSDWDAFEISWDFTKSPLLAPDHRVGSLAAIYADLRARWQDMTNQMQRLEEENNRIFIDAFGLQNELTPEVPVEEVTLTCNPAYRYGGKATTEELEARLLQDTMAEFLHYAVGCMFGRYSLDAPGLILANQGEGTEDYLARVPKPSFVPDRDNVIPILDADWFADDIVTRTRDFLRVTFGEAKFRENLAFIEKALGKDLRKWFTKDFFDYHVRRYKKRPIYWLFSSPKGSFNALIYMHRYRPDTVSIVLNQYLREFIHKLEVERARLEKLTDDPNATQSARTKAQMAIGAVIKQITELTEWERDIVYPMAQQKIAIDLDDGVKRNYPLFAGALKPIKGLEAADD